MPTPIILIEVALLFFALGVIVHAWVSMKKDDFDEFDLTPFDNHK